VSSRRRSRKSVKNGMAAITPGNMRVEIVVNRSWPPEVLYLAKLYAAGMEMSMTIRVLKPLIIIEFRSGIPACLVVKRNI
jgi:hypothetical protein